MSVDVGMGMLFAVLVSLKPSAGTWPSARVCS